MSTLQAYGYRVLSENLRTLAFGGISGVYAAIGTALLFPSRKMIIQNETDVLLTFSDDGVNNKFVLPPGGQVIFDWKYYDNGDYYAVGTIFYVKGAPTLGAVYLSTWYGKTVGV